MRKSYWGSKEEGKNMKFCHGDYFDHFLVVQAAAKRVRVIGYYLLIFTRVKLTDDKVERCQKFSKAEWWTAKINNGLDWELSLDDCIQIGSF